MSKINADLDETKIILVSYFKIVIYSSVWDSIVSDCIVLKLPKSV